MPAERVEQKYFVAPAKLGLALALLRRTCRWDGEYPEEQINSLYFDTVDLDQHQRSLAGEFAKDKIRIRWYGTWPGSSEADGLMPVWLELKSRRGFASTKQRRPLQISAGAIAPASLSRGIVPITALRQTMAEFGFFGPGRLVPVVAISYWRRRFVEPRTGLRVALDSRISSTMIMPGIGRGERGLELPGAVIEVKGATMDLPPSLRQAADLGSSWTRYSKYSSSLEAHMGAQGSVSRLWPSGTMHAEACVGIPELN
ncbi:MAG: VTC domain-containing protein [Thermoleophilia bacterium]|nr:VTC domain-containing protein [Thermoleophilia bacterium]